MGCNSNFIFLAKFGKNCSSTNMGIWNDRCLLSTFKRLYRDCNSERQRHISKYDNAIHSYHVVSDTISHTYNFLDRNVSVHTQVSLARGWVYKVKEPWYIPLFMVIGSIKKFLPFQKVLRCQKVILSIFIFSQYFFSIDFFWWKSTPTLLILWFINFKTLFKSAAFSTTTDFLLIVWKI